MKRFAFVCALVLVAAACSPARLSRDEDAFFRSLAEHCGRSYAGRTVFPTDPADPFVDARLVMRVADCSRDELRIPFDVGENRSRTWILSRTRDGLLFKHDHRHEDGTPEDITMYGGFADGKGTPSSQSFPADSQTSQMLPEAATNVWTLTLDSEKGSFTYVLKRHGNLRFQAEFDLTEPVE